MSVADPLKIVFISGHQLCSSILRELYRGRTPGPTTTQGPRSLNRWYSDHIVFKGGSTINVEFYSAFFITTGSALVYLDFTTK